MRHLLRGTAVVLALVVGGCALAVRHPTVAELRYNPSRYYDHTVDVQGVVTNSWGIPLVPYQMYSVNDGTGDVTVLAQHGRTPPKGARVKVRGKVEDVAVLGGRSVGLHIREEHVDFKGR